MRYLNYLFMALIIALPASLFAGIDQHEVSFISKDRPDEEIYAYYDLRNRSTYIQVTHEEDDENPICIHVQIYQQDQGCSELDFNDQLTPSDTVVYDMDNLIRNNGTEVPIDLNDDSYGYVTVSAVTCDTNEGDDNLSNPLLGNFRIIDDAGYEYRMNMFTGRGSGFDQILLPFSQDGSPEPAFANVIIPFNTVDGANQADIIAFISARNMNLAGISVDAVPDPDDDLVYNEEAGITFSVFQVDENEERLSCDQKTFGCGPNVTLNYGVNEDYPNSRGGPLLCEGGGLTEGQTNGYISLENASFLSPTVQGNFLFQFVCMVGLNNGNGTGSMDSCLYECIDEDSIINDCRF